MNDGDRFDPFGKFKGCLIPQPILESRELSMGAKVVYAALAARSRDGECRASAEALACQVVASERAVRAWVTELVRAKLIVVERVYGAQSRVHFLWKDLLESGIHPANGAGSIRQDLPVTPANGAGSYKEYKSISTTKIERHEITAISTSIESLGLSVTEKLVEDLAACGLAAGITPFQVAALLERARRRVARRPDLQPQSNGWLFGVVTSAARKPAVTEINSRREAARG